MHILLYFGGKLDQVGRLGAVWQLLLERLVKRFILSGDDDHLERRAQRRNVAVHAEDVFHAEAARHNQNRGQLGG